MPWEHLIDEADLARLLPGPHKRFAAPVRESLVLFLSRLPAERQAEILARQAELPVDATLAVRLGELAFCCPVLHKLGQIIARDRRVEPELREQLSQLESLPPRTSVEEIEAVLRRELGSLEDLGLKLAPPAIAEASVAVVIPFTNTAGTLDGVFKVLKPGIQERLAEELALMVEVGAFLESECRRLGIPQIDYQDAFHQVKEKLAWELRLDEEQQNLRHARTFFAHDPRVLIPEVYPYCTSCVTAMQRVHGTKVTEHGHTDRREAVKLARIVARSLIAAPVFSPAPTAMFHSDPHAGNLYATTDGRLAILDWSLVGELGENQRLAVAQILLGGVMLSGGKVLTALESLANSPIQNPSALQEVVEESLTALSRNGLPSMAWLVELLDNAALQGGLRVSADLMMFRKSLLTLTGVLTDLEDEGWEQEKVMLLEFAMHFAAEWPQRWLRLPCSRNYATRLSNLDLAEAASALPWTLARRLTAAAFGKLEYCLSYRRPASHHLTTH